MKLRQNGTKVMKSVMKFTLLVVAGQQPTEASDEKSSDDTVMKVIVGKDRSYEKTS